MAHTSLSGRATCLQRDEALNASWRNVLSSLRVPCLQGQYDQQGDFTKLDERMNSEEKCRRVADRIFYLSIPPSIFTTVAACASQAASSQCDAALHGACLGSRQSRSLWEVPPAPGLIFDPNSDPVGGSNPDLDSDIDGGSIQIPACP